MTVAGVDLHRECPICHGPCLEYEEDWAWLHHCPEISPRDTVTIDNGLPHEVCPYCGVAAPERKTNRPTLLCAVCLESFAPELLNDKDVCESCEANRRCRRCDGTGIQGAPMFGGLSVGSTCRTCGGSGKAK